MRLLFRLYETPPSHLVAVDAKRVRDACAELLSLLQQRCERRCLVNLYPPREIEERLMQAAARANFETAQIAMGAEMG